MREIDYLREENHVLKQSHGKRRILLTDEQRRRLAAKAAALGRRVLERTATIVTPDTLLRWHKKFIAAKWATTGSRVGRPRKPVDVRSLVLRLARDNPTWGSLRIAGMLRELGHAIARSTVRQILKDAGIPPAPERQTSWRQFLKTQASAIAAIDFFATEVWTWSGLQTFYTLFAIHHGSRKVEVLGTTTNPDGAYMQQLARNVTGVASGWWRDLKFLLMDRDTKFDEDFRGMLKGAGIKPILLPRRAPNANAIAERFVRSIKRECLGRMILIGEESLLRALREYVEHYNRERHHQGVGNRLLDPRPADVGGEGPVRRRGRLGGLLNFYRRSAG
ncbi:MAG: integrase core domain-containing protein [Burkholderiaceae bacterium]